MARKQSSKIYFDGKYHNEIVFDGHYHDAMYLSDGSGVLSLVWKKLGNGELFVMAQERQGYMYGNKIYYTGAVYNAQHRPLYRALMIHDNDKNVFELYMRGFTNQLVGVFGQQYYLGDSNNALVRVGDHTYSPSEIMVQNGFIPSGNRVFYNLYFMDFHSEDEFDLANNTCNRKWFVTKHYYNTSIPDEELLLGRYIFHTEGYYTYGQVLSDWFMQQTYMARVLGNSADGNSWRYCVERYTISGAEVGDIVFDMQGRYAFSNIATREDGCYFIAYTSEEDAEQRANVFRFDGASVVPIKTIFYGERISSASITTTRYQLIVNISTSNSNGYRVYSVPPLGGELKEYGNTYLRRGVFGATETESDITFYTRHPQYNEYTQVTRYLKDLDMFEDLGIDGMEFVE